MGEIESKLHEIHAEARERRGSEGEGRGKERKVGGTESVRGFAKINAVTEGSPADHAVRIYSNDL